MKENDIESGGRAVRVRFGEPPETGGAAPSRKTMTTKEVAEALGCNPMTIFNNAKVCLPNKRVENGKQTFWMETEVTILLEYMKRNNNNQHDLIRSLEGVETTQSLELEAETAESIARTCGYSVETVRRIIRELGFSENGVKTVLTQEQAEVVKRRIIANLSRGTNNANRPTTTVVVGVEDPMLELASLYARIDEIKSARIATLEAENAEKAERLSIVAPKAETLDKITATNSDISVRELAAILAAPHLGQNKLFQRLREDGYIDELNRPYRQYIEAGLLYEKEYYVPQLDATKLQLRITQKGVAHFAKKYGGA